MIARGDGAFEVAEVDGVILVHRCNMRSLEVLCHHTTEVEPHRQHRKLLFVLQLLVVVWVVRVQPQLCLISLQAPSYLHFLEFSDYICIFLHVCVDPQHLLTLLLQDEVEHLRVKLALHHALVVDVVDGALDITVSYALRVLKQVVCRSLAWLVASLAYIRRLEP